MKITVTGRQIELTTADRARIRRQVERLKRPLGKAALSTQVAVARDGAMHVCEVTLHASGDHMLHARGRDKRVPIAVAQAVTIPNIPIPLSSGIFSIVMGVVSILQAVFRHHYLIGEREKYRKWLPNWGAIALSWVIPAPVFSNAALIGAIVAALWRKYDMRTWDIYGYAIAAGMLLPSLHVSRELRLTPMNRFHRWRGTRRCFWRHPHTGRCRWERPRHQHCVPHERVLLAAFCVSYWTG